jgi:sulfate permease, SulP family
MIRATGRYNWERFLGDCAGGMIAALIALPYGLSMATLMRLPPILGVVTSILTAPITALLGRNPVLIGGTASATVPFIANAVKAQGIGGAAKVSIVASVFMMAFCVLRLGRFVAKVPATVVAGFSAGIGGIMFISQMHVLLGVHATNSDNSLVQLF